MEKSYCPAQKNMPSPLKNFFVEWLDKISKKYYY